MEGTEKPPIKNGLMNFYVHKPYSFVYLKPSIYNSSNNRFLRGLIIGFSAYFNAPIFQEDFFSALQKCEAFFVSTAFELCVVDSTLQELQVKCSDP